MLHEQFTVVLETKQVLKSGKGFCFGVFGFLVFASLVFTRSRMGDLVKLKAPNVSDLFLAL
jgi:hypothetical protein